MSRPHDFSEALKAQRRLRKLQSLVRRVSNEMLKPMTHPKRRSSITIAGRILNQIIGVFAVSEEITLKLTELNAALMRVQTIDDTSAVFSFEVDLLNNLLFDIQRRVDLIERETGRYKHNE